MDEQSGAGCAGGHALHFLQEAAVPLDSETQVGEDVPIYSSGPMSHLVRGSLVLRELQPVAATGTRTEHRIPRYRTLAA